MEKTHNLYTHYRKIWLKTLAIMLVFSGPYTYGATYSDGELRKISELVPDSPKLRQSLPRLKERAKEKDAGARLLYGKALLSAKMYDDGLEVLKTINTEVEVRALLLMAKAYELRGEASERVRVLELLRKSHPDSEYVVLILADAYLKSKNVPKSVEVVKEHIKKKPKQKAAYLALFDIYEQTKNNYEIRVLLSDMKETFQNDSEVWTRHCKYYAEGGFLEQASTSCARATSLAPKTAENYVYLGLTKKNLKETEEAEKTIKQAAQRFPQSELAQYTAGQMSDEVKNWEVSARYYQTCTKTHPTSDRCQRGLGKSAFEIAKYDVALAAFAISCHKDMVARTEFRNAITVLRNKNKNDTADEFNKKFERCGLSPD